MNKIKFLTPIISLGVVATGLSVATSCDDDSTTINLDKYGIVSFGEASHNCAFREFVSLKAETEYTAIIDLSLIYPISKTTESEILNHELTFNISNQLDDHDEQQLEGCDIEDPQIWFDGNRLEQVETEEELESNPCCFYIKKPPKENSSGPTALWISNGTTETGNEIVKIQFKVNKNVTDFFVKFWNTVDVSL